MLHKQQQEAHALLSRLLALAYVDQDVDLREIELIYSIALERGIARDELEGIMLRPHLVVTVLPATTDERISHVYDLARLVMADGIARDEERAMLKRSVLVYEFEPSLVDDLVDFLLEQASLGTESSTVVQLVGETL